MTRAALLCGVVALALAALVGANLAFTANNDVLLQLLSVKGFQLGAGYGFPHPDGSWEWIPEREASTRWPPGLTLLGYAAAAAGADPLIALACTQPLLLALSFLVLTDALRRSLDLAAAAAISLTACATGCVLQWHQEAASEPWAFLFASLLFRWTTRIPKDGGSASPWLIVSGWALASFRTAGVYFVPAVAAAWAFSGGAALRSRAVRGTAFALLLAAPAGLFHLYSGWRYPAPPGLPAEPPVSAMGQLRGNVAVLAEVALPHLYNLNETIGFALGAAALVAACWAAAGLIRARRFTHPVVVALLMGLAYIAGLTFSAVKFRYDWAGLYRVNGFAIPWLAIALFGGIWIRVEKRALRTALLCGLLALGAGRLAHAGRQLSARAPSGVSDYRVAAAALGDYAAARGLKDVTLCIDGWPGRNRHRSMLYASYFAGLPLRVHAAKPGEPCLRLNDAGPRSPIIWGGL